MRPTRPVQLIPLLLAASHLTWACRDTSNAQTTPPARILVFSKTAGYRHASIEPGIAALSRLAEERGVDLVATEDAGMFDTATLEGYDAVVFLSTTGDVLNTSQEEAFTAFIDAGGGFVGIHSATDTEYEWAWYGQLVGGYFERHPSNPNVRQGTLTVVDPSHRATAGLPNPWTRTDEWYEIRDLAPDLEILLTIDESSYKTPDEDPGPAPRPLAWHHGVNGGRAFYTALGHTSESYEDPLFLDHVWGGLQYVLDAVETNPP